MELPKKPEPLRIEFEVTNYCNADCFFCPRTNIQDYGMMSLDKYKKFLESLSEVRQDLWLWNQGFKQFPRIVFGGYGESLIHKKFSEFITSASSLGYETELITNGLLLNEENTEMIIQSGLEHLAISLHSLDPEINKALLNSAKDPIPNIKSALRRIDSSDLEVEIWRVADFDGSTFSDEDYSSFLSQFDKNIRVLGPTPAWNRGGQYKSDFHPLVKDSEAIRCETAFFTMNISYNGDFLLCCCDFSTKKMVVAEQWDFDMVKVQNRILDYLQSPTEMCNSCRKPGDNIYSRQIRSLQD